MKVITLRPGFAEIALPWRDDFIGDPSRPAGHGGVLSALMDATGGAAVFADIDFSRGERVSTIDLLVDYLRPAPLEAWVCQAKVVRLGSRVALAQMNVWAGSTPDEWLASGRGAYNIRRKLEN